MTHTGTRVFLTLLLSLALLLPQDNIRASAVSSFDADAHAQLAAIALYLKRNFESVKSEPLSQSELQEIIESGTRWLIRTQEPDGHFAYEYAPYTDERLLGDNLVRQTGALYQLGELAQRSDTKDTALRDAVRQGVAYMEALTAEDNTDQNTIRCIAYTKAHASCPLGATSLALAGILGYLDAYPEEEKHYQTLIDGYVAYILASQKDNGGFRNVHAIGKHSQSQKESSFSNGEALMALVRYYERTGDTTVKAAIDRTFAYLKEQPFDGPLYLWIMAALKDLHALEPDAAYTTYAKTYTEWRIAGVSRYRGTDNNYCAYAEGIASAYSLLAGTIGEAQLQDLKSEIDYWNRKNGALQLTDGDRYRVIAGSGSLRLAEMPKPENALGGFLTSHDDLTLRIDFTQHCLSAYLQTLVDIEGQAL